ncbi:MAG: four-carbon acid sugar kinase family protein [Kaiparowitsia implicata GSE-PSE-MK54-09C]|nr:four-carbon acid sugar kinase family protein [Kaiparowitsia implicata GSE-PSE-MK54-09C]
MADALAQALGTHFAVVCPAFPANGRTVYRGHLFVGNQLLQDSSMKDHPLTPMRRSSLVDPMAAQSARRVGLVRYDVIGQDVATIRAEFARLRDACMGFAMTDAIADADLRRLGQAVHDHPLKRC